MFYSYEELKATVEEAINYKIITIDTYVQVLRDKNLRITAWYFSDKEMQEIFSEDCSNYCERKKVLKLKADYNKDKENLENIFVKDFIFQLKENK